MNKQQLFENIKQKSFLCVGLDTDIKKFPNICWKKKIRSLHSTKQSLTRQPICVSPTNPIWLLRKHGRERMDRIWKDSKIHQRKLSRPIYHRRRKRGDIGNTSAMYARTFFEELDIDSVNCSSLYGWRQRYSVPCLRRQMGDPYWHWLQIKVPMTSSWQKMQTANVCSKSTTQITNDRRTNIWCT